MTRRTNARLAGFLFLFYIAIAMTDMVLSGRVTSGEGTAAKLANIALHLPQMRLVVVLEMLTIFAALALAVALYALTRDEDPELALMALMCRVTEGVINAVSTIGTLGLLSLATTAAAAAGPEVATGHSLAALLLRTGSWSTTVSATVFSVGSALYSYLFLRARSIPVSLAGLGLIGSLLMIVILPLDGLKLISGAVVGLSWMPLLVFELTLGLWLLIKGVAERPSSPRA